jgi:hypothetical protein
MALSDADRARLVKLARMLGSPFDGERAAAGLLIHGLLAKQGIDWAELLQPAQPPAVVVPPPPRTWAVVAEEILAARYSAVRAREAEFLTGLLLQGWAPSEAQADWLADIAERCGIPLWDDPPPPSRDERRARMRERRAGRSAP